MIFFLLAMAAIALISGIFLARGAMQTARMAAQAEAAVPPLGPLLTISTGKLHYFEKGQGPAIVMIHGLGGQLRHFTLALVDLLATDHRVVVLDRPGMGYSDRPDSASASLEAQAGYVLEVMDALGLDKPLIVGHSLGGAIALALALRAPDRVRALALLAPLTRSIAAHAKVFRGYEIRTNWLRRLMANTVAIPAIVRNQAMTVATIFGPDPVPRNYSVGGGGLLALRPGNFYNGSRDFLAIAPSIQPQQARYDALHMPVEILFGTEDRILDHRYHGLELARDHPAITVHLVEGAGHMLPLNHPERCAEFIRAVDART